MKIIAAATSIEIDVIVKVVITDDELDDCTSNVHHIKCN